MSSAGVLRLTRAIALPWPWLLVAIVAISLVERAWMETTPDVGWLLTLGERTLAGERPYVDFIEANPPASIYLYFPALFLARASGFSPEFMLGLVVFTLIATSLSISARILIRGGVLPSASAWPLAAVFAMVLLVLPATTFAQREHFALILFLPMLAVAALRAQRAQAVWSWIIIAAVGAGLTVIIKPHFALPVIFTAAAAALCARSWRSLFAPEYWIAAGITALYGVAVAIFHPEFVYEWVPVITEVYVSQKADVFDLLTLGATPFWCGALLVIFALKRRKVFAPPFVLLLAASAGFFIAFISQHKGLPYHSYPMLALVFAAALIAAGDRVDAVGRQRLILPFAVVTVAGLLAVTFSFYAHTVNTHPFVAPIQASVSRPKVLNISGFGLVSVGFPLTRQLGGTWVGRTCGQWVTVGAQHAKRKTTDAETTARLDRYIERDRTMLIEDIRRAKPDIILVDRIHPESDSYEWARKHADLSRELDNYRPLDEINGVLILRRK